MLSTALIWRYITVFIALFQQITIINTLNLLLEETFPKKMNQDDFIILPNDNVTGCRLLYCPNFHYYFIYSDSCKAVPSGTEMSNGIGLYLRTTKIEIIRENDFTNWTQLLTLNIEMNSELAEIETGKKKTNQTADGKYKYDAFVSYSHEDRNFVVRLVSMLETQSPYYTLCVFERDFSVGNIITENVVDCLSTSRRTILVLSDSFAKSTWCLWEMHLAQHKRLFFKNDETEPLIIIKLGEIMDKHMTPTLRYLIKTRIYLQWHSDPKKQKIFWQKLREALAPPKIQV